MASAVCPSCGETIKVTGQVKIGRYITCPICDEMLEIIDVNPIELDWAFYDDEDNEDDLDYEEQDEDEDDWDN
ncbi:MAG: hypothetical protein GYA30_09965 [Chloroflexi bacterium]|nr:hypothetical protein [Chloroflexota bacterium]OQB01851.1 MAG: hypothetical protein BWY25_00877 [Chloroflexi bacterium ADurb.Bin222]HOC20724.1 hypothetical protein [Anaerolineae bacterium]HPD40936.1 hypothetical protein [Anaerolineae bacterium]HQE99656.1 hypothetical protein [Anaerolineae bacterium]